MTHKATSDGQFRKPFIDIEQQREKYYYVHGGFEGTDLKFSFFFPKKEKYKGRFFHFIAPVPGSEDAATVRSGQSDEIGFALKNGAYYVETNFGLLHPFGPIPDNTIIYRASAAAAEFSRKVAIRLYGEHYPYGYIYGGSGGGYKSISCFENADAWDGAVPYVIGSYAALPSMFTVRSHAKRILRHKFAQVADALEPGSGKSPFDGLNEEEKAALEEATKLGFPIYDWFSYPFLDTGSLPRHVAGVKRHDPSYFIEFWEKEGYLGADKTSSVHRDRIRLTAKIVAISMPKKKKQEFTGMNGVDDAWQKERSDLGWEGKAKIVLDNVPASNNIYYEGLSMTVQCGAEQGLEIPIEKFEGNTAVVGVDFMQADLLDRLQNVSAGTEIRIDNSDYLAIQTYHRHQTPQEEFEGWKQFKNADGTPKYPQRDLWFSPMCIAGGAGSLQSGKFKGKMIVVEAQMDESAFPWQADWYRKKVAANHTEKEEDYFRLWYVEKAFHADDGKTPDDFHLVTYLGVLHQALLDLSDWVEHGIIPAPTSVYEIQDGQVFTPTKNRGGIQPTVVLKANGKKRTETQKGETVLLEAEVDLPVALGKVIKAEWSFEGELYQSLPFEIVKDGAICKSEHSYNETGLYFATIRVTATRDGSDEPYVYTQNIDRVRIIVK